MKEEHPGRAALVAALARALAQYDPELAERRRAERVAQGADKKK